MGGEKKRKPLRKGDRLGWIHCPLCGDEIVGQIIEAIYPGLVVTRAWCTRQEIWVFGCNLEPEYGTVNVTAAF